MKPELERVRSFCSWLGTSVVKLKACLTGWGTSIVELEACVTGWGLHLRSEQLE